LRAIIDTHIAIDRTEIPEGLRLAVCSALSVKNPDRDRAISEKIPGAKDLPEKLELWAETATHLVLPRGYAHALDRLANAQGVQINWDRRMTLYAPSERQFAEWPTVDLRGYQAEARDQMLDWTNGIMKAPTGAGKTRVALEVARWAGQPTLIIVDKTALAKQWATVIEESYGARAGLIGDGTWDEQPITIALRQSLWSRRETTPDSFYRHWGMVVVDEVHHASAETLMDLLQRFSAFYRLGYSATPVWDKMLFPFIEAVIGPVVHSTDAASIGEVLIKPMIRVMPTEFEFEFVRTQMRARYRVQNNYTELITALCDDADRNLLIANTAMDEAVKRHHVLVTTRRIEHVKKLEEELRSICGVSNPWKSEEDQVNVLVLTGKESKHSERVREAIANATGGTILISTVADEALDIPRLDRLIMAFPARRVPLVEQQIGRIMRPAPGKTDAIVYDIFDEKIGVIKSQYRERMQQLYLKRRWKVERLERVPT
jgi:superfamily II DNA or RNA helicase